MAGRQHGSERLSVLSWLMALVGVVSFTLAGALLTLRVIDGGQFVVLSSLGAACCLTTLVVGALANRR